MPRRRNNGNLILLDETTLSLDDPVRPVKSFLKNQVWELLKEKQKEIECSICLEGIDCKNCYCLLTCGHSFNLCCIVGQTRCPLCRN